MGETKRYIVPAYGPQKEPIETALKLAGQLSHTLKTPENALDITLLVPAKGNLKNSVLSEVIGPDITKDLLKNGATSLPDGGFLRMESEQTFHSHGARGVLVGVHARKNMLNLIDEAKNVEVVIIVPWLMEEVEYWVRAWNPSIFGETQKIPQPLIENPILEVALETLSNSVNLSSGLVHPMDKNTAITLFQKLRDEGKLVNVDVETVYAWAIRNNWTTRGAEQLKEVVSGVIEGKRFRTGHTSYWAPNIMEQLHEKAKQKQTSIDSKQS